MAAVVGSTLEDLKKQAARESLLNNVKISAATVSYVGNESYGHRFRKDNSPKDSEQDSNGSDGKNSPDQNKMRTMFAKAPKNIKKIHGSHKQK